MARAKKIPQEQVAVLLGDDTIYYYPIKGTSADPVPENLPHLMHGNTYAKLSDEVRKVIKKVARRHKCELSYELDVELMSYDPTQPVETSGVYLVATIHFK